MFNYETIDDKTRILVALTKIFVDHENEPMDSKELFRELYDKYKIDCRNATALSLRMHGSGMFARKNLKLIRKENRPKKARTVRYEYFIRPYLYSVIIDKIGYEIRRMTVSYAASKLEETIGKELAGKSAAV